MNTHHIARRVGFALMGSLLLTLGCGGRDSTSSAPQGPPPEYKVIDLTPGTGASPHPGDQITVNYTGWLYDPGKTDNKGKQFDTSNGRGPFTFTLRTGQVIPGWDAGFTDMRIGGTRRLIIPPTFGYGAQGTPDGTIPPNATLVFEMQLLDVKSR